MPQKRRLEDFYVIGKELEFDDGASEDGPDGPVKLPTEVVWLRKLNPVEAATALRKANAVRARVRAACKDQATDEYQTLWLEVDQMGMDANLLIEYVVMDKIAEAGLKADARTAEEEEWSKDDYIQGLRDAWADGLEAKYIADEDDPEAKRVFAELNRFGDAARALADAEIEEAKDEWRGLPVERLREKVMDIQASFRASNAWLNEFHRCEVWLGTFESDRRTRYFDKREELDRLPGEITRRLLDEYADLSVDALEGKGSEETQDSSSSSEQLDAGATGDSSGLVAATP